METIKSYALHVKTKLTLAPWQYYSYSFLAKNEWLEIRAPFKDFKKSNFYQPKKLSNQNIKSIGLVAAFDNFYADICLAEIDYINIFDLKTLIYYNNFNILPFLAFNINHMLIAGAGNHSCKSLDLSLLCLLSFLE